MISPSTRQRPTDDPRRTANRVTPASLRCNLGSVRDVSPCGLRITGRKVGRSRVDLQLYALDKSVNVRGRVVWSRFVGNFETETGIAFTEVTRQQAKELTRIASSGGGRCFL
ncbi:MAG: PilZ domain-containing protein [Phycisphaerales bacterium]|nr:PilZ domain-containing protein [Phycisphaerae bacterium]NNF41966.1 PilZ domain-containing protein [Phycisphaerales bacterium]NNM26779.1 PilZ domain-containing protein [Phycisphaerales bacterium]